MNPLILKWMRVYLKCYLNLILYHRNVYPRSSFTFTTYHGFNLPQYMPITRHPGLNSYIEEFILDIMGKIEHIYRLNICVVSKETGWCVERYVLDFGEFQHGVEPEGISATDELDVFDEFRASLNSLIVYLEKQLKIRDDTVIFDLVIDTVEMDLGHNFVSDPSKTYTEEEVTDFERDNSWVRFHQDQNLPDPVEASGYYKPKLKLTSLVGCEWGSIRIQQFNERLLMPNKGLSQIYYDDGLAENAELTIGSLN